MSVGETFDVKHIFVKKAGMNTILQGPNLTKHVNTSNTRVPDKDDWACRNLPYLGPILSGLIIITAVVPFPS